MIVGGWYPPHERRFRTPFILRSLDRRSGAHQPPTILPVMHVWHVTYNWSAYNRILTVAPYSATPHLTVLQLIRSAHLRGGSTSGPVFTARARRA